MQIKLIPLLLTALVSLAHAAPDSAPSIVHTPWISAKADAPVRIVAQISGDWRAEGLWVYARWDQSKPFERFPLERLEQDYFQATIPPALARGPGLAYYIAAQGEGGAEAAHFASKEDPHWIDVVGQSAQDVHADQLARYDGRRSRLRLGGQMTAYGPKPLYDVYGAPLGDTEALSDRYWELHGEYTYRPLSWLHDLRIGFNVMRGAWPEIDGAPTREGRSPGVYAGYAEGNVELHRWLSVGGRLLLGANAEGFSPGFGFIGRIGDMAGVHFALDAEYIDGVGDRTDLRFHWDTVPRVPMGIGIELTDWPGEGDEAANLSYDVGFELGGGLLVEGRIGSANRGGSKDHGWLGGLHMSKDF